MDFKIIGLMILGVLLIGGCVQETKTPDTYVKPVLKLMEGDIQIVSAQWYSDAMLKLQSGLPWETLCQNPEKLLPSADWELTVNASLPSEITQVSCHYYADSVKSEYPGMVLYSGINQFNRRTQYDTFNVDSTKDVTISLCCSVNEDDTFNKKYDICVSHSLKSACN
jgi:hypothetical protein